MADFDEGDQLDNLWINCWEDDTLDQYVNDLDKNANENIQYEKEQCNQKLFQSFQNSACAVAQMFKDKTQAISPWNSFQDAAGSITVLYKDSLDSCKLNLDLGVNIGQQRKIKELINWLRKKKRRYVRKDELISFLIGKQAPNSTRLLNRNNNRNELLRQQLVSRCNPNVDVNHVTSTHSDLATFREALIMHNRTRDNHPSSLNCHTHTTNNNSHQNSLFTTTTALPSAPTTASSTLTSNLFSQQQQLPSIFSSTTTTTNNNNNNSHQLTASSHQNNNCDDLDCFFCEQIATHIDHKRSANNTDLDSPTRKRSRFN